VAYISLTRERNESHHRIEQLERELQWAILRIQVLEERLRLRRIRMLGPHSETLSNLQLQLLAEEEPGVTADEVEAESKRPPVAEEPRRERQPHPGRAPLPEHLNRVEQIVACPNRNCRHCGQETAVVGCDQSEYLDMEPVSYCVRVIKREKRVCRCCEQGGVTMVPLAPRIIPKSQPGNRVIVDTIVSKYWALLPKV
jgi:transposase